MTCIQKKRIWYAHLFQVVILFFILFHAYSNNPIRVHSDSKPMFCISSGTSVVVREASEPLSATVSFVNLHHVLEKDWLCAEWVRSSAWFTNTALSISNRVYNTFYTIITIHAP